MDIDDLRALFGLSRAAIHKYRRQRLIPPPSPPHRWGKYGREHVEAIRAIMALRHTATSLREVAALCTEDGISVVDYVRRREESIKRHGLSVA